MSLRYFSTVYDSVKQRETEVKFIKNGEGKAYLRKYYKAFMKLDLLLHGSLILTDAQFFDGAYFHALAGDGYVSEELTDFYKFINTFNEDYPKIEVKCRPEENGADTLYVMLSKKNFKSSAAGNENTLYRSALNEAVERIEKNNNDKTIRNLTDIALDYIKQNYNDRDAVMFQEYQSKLIKLNELVFNPSAKILSRWKTVIKNPDTRQDEDAYNFYMRSQTASYIAQVNRLDGYVLSDLGEKLSPILCQDKIERSNVYYWFDYFKKYEALPESIFNEILRLETDFNNIYFKAIATQHNCRLYHTSHSCKDYSPPNKPVDIPITASLLDILSKESWLEFSELLNNGEMKKAYKYWHECSGKKEEEKALKKYIQLINSHYIGKSSKDTIEKFNDVNNITTALSAIITADAKATPVIGIVLLSFVNRDDRTFRLILDSHSNTKGILEYYSHTIKLD